MDQRIETTWWVLRLALGITAFLAGLDKFFNLLANWESYLSPLASQVLPISSVTFMQVVGVIEMAVAALILLGYSRLGGYIAAIWLVGIALNLVTTGQYFDIAARDVVMAMAALSLARLTEYRESVLGTDREASRMAHSRA
ncbi:MAG: DoxX family membrane protein [Acidobacteria bacterium]|nr:MAG: DoxX family membrane protein [Acidobacteriota bacterium]